MPIFDDWYNFAICTNGFPTNAEIDSFLDGLDVVMSCETPLNYYLFERARQRGVRTVLQPNYEFFDYLSPRGVNLPTPDVFAFPSEWNLNTIRPMLFGTPVEHLPVPIDLADLPQHDITQARQFVHIAGRPAVNDRNGTLDFIAAVRMVHRQMPGAEFVVYCQQPTPAIEQAIRGSGARLVGHVDSPADMYASANVLVLPRRYGGLCLPAQEAVGCGIPVLMPNISPNNAWLPANWLVPVKPEIRRFMARCPIDVYSVNIPALATRMLALYRDDAAVVQMHGQAKQLAQTMTWDALMPRYEEVLGLKELVA